MSSISAVYAFGCAFGPGWVLGDARSSYSRFQASHSPSLCTSPLLTHPQEYSGIRSGKGSTFDDLLVAYTHELAELLEAQGVTRGSRLQVGGRGPGRGWGCRAPGQLGWGCRGSYKQ